MKGFQTQVKIGSLRADSIGNRNGSLATVCVNARGHKGGLEGYNPDIQPFPPIYTAGGALIDTSINWPFPQIFHTDTGLYVGTKVGLYQVSWDPVDGRWEGVNLISGYSSGIDWPWTLANNPMFPVFASGDCFVYYDYDNTAWEVYNKEHSVGTGGSRWHSDWYQPVAACFFRGQIITIGSKTATSSPSESRIIRWSEIGSFDFLGKTANTRKNTAGFIYAGVDDNEILMRCLPLKVGVVVYGGFTTYFLKPVDRPVSTYSPRVLLDMGISSPLAVAGNETKHLMIDTSGCAHMITYNIYENAEQKRLGYEEFLKPMISEDLTLSVVYNPSEDEFYISNGVKSYLYNDLGLTEISSMVTSYVDFTGKLLASEEFAQIEANRYGYIGSTGEEHFLYESDILDMSMNGIKTVETVELGISIDYDASLEVMVKWRNDRRAPFRETSWKRCSPDGVGFPIVSGSEVKVCVRAVPYTGIELNSIIVKWKLSDKRYTRGIYASSSTA